VKILAFKIMHDFPLFLSCDHTILWNTLTTEYACCISSWTRTNYTAFRSFFYQPLKTPLIKTLS